MKTQEESVNPAVITTKKEDYLFDHPTSTTVAFGFGAMADQMSHQAFTFLVFTYYYAVVELSTLTLAAAFIGFAIWDSINDPLFGPISDKTTSKHGRRGFWVLIITIPFGLINILLFTPPKFWPNPIDSTLANVTYMIAIIMLYDLFYTIFSSSQLALFPEMFKTEKKRARANKFKNILTIVGVLLGFALPTFIISPLVPNETITAEVVNKMYVITGIIICVLVWIFGFLFLKYGMREDSVEITKPESIPGIIDSLKTTIEK